MSSSANFKAVARVFLKLGFSAALTIVLLEIALRIFDPLSLEICQTDKIVRQNLPGIKPQIHYTRNRFGLRSVSMADATSLDKPANTVRIICIGASTTDQPIQSTEDIWWAILEKKLQSEFARAGAKIEVGGYGIGGQTVSNRLEWCRTHLLAFKPDLVMTLEGINDLCFRGYRHSTRDIISLGDRLSKVLAHSQICSHLIFFMARSGRILEWHSRSMPQLRRTYAGYPLVETPERDPDCAAQFKTDLCRLLQFFTAQHIPVVVLGQPASWKSDMSAEEYSRLWFPVVARNGFVRPSAQWLSNEMRKYNALQQECARANNACYLALDEWVPRTTNVFVDDCHFTDEGNRLVADLIYPEVVKIVHGLIQARMNSQKTTSL
jgi:lysophospholipase L1-like esterase